ncbi:MAG: universal stress protein, partial [Spirillospora sp.]
MIGDHVLAGYVNDAGGREALDLAWTMAALTGGRLSVATVHPPNLPAAAGEARTLLDQAADLLDGRPADLHVQEGRSVGRGLTVLASRIGADLIVVGS